MLKKIAFITGATAGIGKACAEKLAHSGFNLILTGRRKNKLDELKSNLSLVTEVKVLSFDIQNREEVEQAWNELDDTWRNVDVLINNAGLAQGLDPIHEGDILDWDRMIDTNLKGLLYITRLVSKVMVARKFGHIINIGSIAGKEAYLNGNVYCATKFAVDGLSKAMRIDLLPFGIRVSAIHPGMVDTEFSNVRFKGDDLRAKGVYAGLKPLTGEDVAEAVLFAVNCPDHVNVSDLVITPIAQANVSNVVRNIA